MIGERVGGRYEILKYIGGGGMSRVYLAHDIILDRDVAIKVLNYDFSNEEELKRRFMREALSATSLTHPHIVDIFDVGEDGDLHYLVMEYIEGQTLKEYIVSHGPLTPEQAVPIMQQLVSAISNAHYNGIVHRDIKPQNILMDHDGNVKITDFGIAMALSATAHTKTNSVLGTVHYLSPEQARGGMATKKSDIYSLGIVLYELLTGELPFSGESAVAIALKHLQEETPSVKTLFPNIPQSVENVILKATAKDAVVRYRSVDEMQEDLSTVLSPERADEEKFTIPYDDEMTRAIPAITDATKFESVEETKKHDPVQVEEAEEPKKKRKKWPFIVGGLVLAGLIALAIIFVPALLGPKKDNVPDVAGMDEAEAVDLLEEKGFLVSERIERTSDDYEEGQVIRTVPEADKLRELGTAITLYVSKGKEKVKVTNYIGRNYDDIYRRLEDSDFKSIDSEDRYSDKPAGEIIEQNPEPGTEVVASETDLVFVVSKGVEKVQLRNLVGASEEELAQYAKTSGFDITVIREEYSATVEKGHVISQKPSSGTQLEKDGKVEVVLSKGAEEKPVKRTTQRLKIVYDPEESEAEEDDNGNQEKKPQTIRIYIKDRNHSMDDLFETFTITEDTMKHIKLELEEGQSGGYKVMRDSELFDEDEFNYDDVD